MKDARSAIWEIAINASHTSLPPPSFAIFQRVYGIEQANLIIDYSSEMCGSPGQRSQTLCPTRHAARVNTISGPLNVSFYSGDEFNSAATISDPLGIFYGFNWNGSAVGPNPQLQVSVFDTLLLTNFELAFNCGIISSYLFPATQRVRLNVEQVNIEDSVDAIVYANFTEHSSSATQCNKFRDYAIYPLSAEPYGEIGATSPQICDTSVTLDSSSSCTNDIAIQFTSVRVTTQISKRPKSWKEWLTDEGGIIGGIQFVTWFSGIFLI